MLGSKAGWEKIREIEEAGIWCGFKIPRFAEQLDVPILTDYGLADSCPNFYRNDPVLFMTRDVRDVVCSMRGLRNKDETWLRHWGIPIINYWINQSEEFASEYAKEIALTRKSGCKGAAIGALYWKFKNAAYNRYQQSGYPVVKVKYEDLVTDPGAQIQNVVGFLGLPWEEGLLGHHKLKHMGTDEQGVAVGGTDAHQKISSKSVGRFRSELSSEELEIIDLIAGDTAMQLGYQLQ